MLSRRTRRRRCCASRTSRRRSAERVGPDAVTALRVSGSGARVCRTLRGRGAERPDLVRPWRGRRRAHGRRFGDATFWAPSCGRPSAATAWWPTVRAPPGGGGTFPTFPVGRSVVKRSPHASTVARASNEIERSLRVERCWSAPREAGAPCSVVDGHLVVAARSWLPAESVWPRASAATSAHVQQHLTGVFLVTPYARRRQDTVTFPYSRGPQRP